MSNTDLEEPAPADSTPPCSPAKEVRNETIVNNARTEVYMDAFIPQRIVSELRHSPDRIRMACQAWRPPKQALGSELAVGRLWQWTLASVWTLHEIRLNYTDNPSAARANHQGKC